MWVASHVLFDTTHAAVNIAINVSLCMLIDTSSHLTVLLKLPAS